MNKRPFSPENTATFPNRETPAPESIALSRREFLQRTLTAVAATSLGASQMLGAASRSAPRPFGFSLYGMKALPLIAAIDHIARIGYQQLELSLIAGFPAEPAKFSATDRRAVRERVQSHGLDLSSLQISIALAGDDQTQATHRETIRRAGEVAHDLNDERLPLVETVLGGKPDDWVASREKFAARLRTWAETADASNVTLCVKGHTGQAVNSPDRLLWLYKAVNHPRLALTYDYSHYQFEGFGLEESLRAIIPHTKFIAVKDVAPGEKNPRFLLVGESGTIDYGKYFQLLDELSYTGPLMVEVSSQIHSRPGYDGVKAAERAYAFLSQVERSHG